MRKLSIAIPASVVSDTPHLREKTSKIGLIGRAAAIFRVNEIIIYADDPHADQTRDIDLVATLLSYMETPQYLRKRLFRLSSDLQYAGILPPLRTPHHPLNSKSKDLKVGEYREGVVVARVGGDSLVEIGVENPALIVGKLPVGKRITVRIIEMDKFVRGAELFNRESVSAYWGYVVSTATCSFGRIVANRSFDLKIATSKYGLPFSHVAKQIVRKWAFSDNILVAFGAPNTGLSEIVAREGASLNNLVDFVVNMIPLQGTATVRTEEAIMATLSVINIAVAGGEV